MTSGNHPGASSRTVRLAGPPELTCTCVLPSLGELVAGGLDLRVTLGRPAEQLLDGLVADAFDIVVSTIQPADPAVTATFLFEEEFVLVAAPAVAGGVDLDRLRNHPSERPPVGLIAFSEDLPIVRGFWRAAFGAPAPEQAAAVVPDLRGVLELAAAGAGMTVLPRYLCRSDLASGRLVSLFDPSPPSNSIYLATRMGGSTEAVEAVSRRLGNAASGW
jgi:DNA-binding transcriptional LysR family regulator